MTDATYTAFNGHRRIASGRLHAVALVVKREIASEVAGPILIFDDTTGRSVDIDTRGSDDEVVARLTKRIAVNEGTEAESGCLLPLVPGSINTDVGVGTPRRRGRPKLGVIPREVTLLPRHWDWLATQPGGASVALRKLVEEARRAHAETDKRRKALERAYHFMSAMAGDMPGFEEAARALFAGDGATFRKLVAAWPGDVRDHAIALASGDAPTER